MKNKYAKKIAALCSAAALMLTSSAVFVSAAGTVDTSKVGALLDSYTAGSGTFTLTADSRIFVVGSSAPTGELLQTVQLIQRQFGAQLTTLTEAKLVWRPESYAKEGDIILCLDTASGIGTEGYKLNVGEDLTDTSEVELAVEGTAKVTATDVDGLIYGANMLMKCLGNSSSLSGFTAVDVPDTEQRVVSLDTGRKYYTKEWICNFIRQMSWMGYNALELHFSEDGGFRADLWDSEYYTDGYQPENDFSWLCGSYVQSWVKDPYRTDHDKDKYLKTAELVQICEVAKEYHIEIIPSFDSPAHMDYICWKFEQNYKSNTSYSFTYNGTTYKASSTSGCINYTGKTGATSPTWPYYTTININSDSSDKVANMAKAFVFALYEDMADFFKVYAGSENFSIGADEVNLSSGYGIDWTYDDFPVYVNSLNQMLNKKGYTVRMFNDFIGTTVYSATEAFDSNIEIMYWNSPYNTNTGTSGGSDNKTKAAENFVDEGRTLYNCIQTHTYYVLRVAAATTSYPNMDARNPKNYNWTFYHSTEDLIYDEWVPNNVSEKGLHSESVDDIPADQLGGAYFLIWNDYAALNTEAEVWNGVYDNTGTSNYFYSLFDRMWSNTMKMWNWDVDDSVTSYTEFAAVRETFGNFPGFTSCSADAYLPAATSPVKAVNKTELAAAVKTKISNADGKYTDESYAVYENAYNAAVTVNNKSDATQDEVDDALSALQAAISSLKEAPVDTSAIVTVNLKSGGTVFNTLTFSASSTDSSFSFYIAPQTGYTFDNVAAPYKFTELASGDGSGFLTGSAKSGDTITVYYTSTPDISYLNALIKDAHTANSYGFTDDSWNAYAAALANAQNFTIDETTCQADIDALANALIAAANALKTSGTEEILAIEKISSVTKSGKQVTLRVITSPAVSALTVSEQSLTTCLSKVQTLNDGSVVKVWLIGFTAPVYDSGTAYPVFTIKADSVEKNVTVTVIK